MLRAWGAPKTETFIAAPKKLSVPGVQNSTKKYSKSRKRRKMYTTAYQARSVHWIKEILAKWWWEYCFFWFASSRVPGARNAIIQKQITKSSFPNAIFQKQITKKQFSKRNFPKAIRPKAVFPIFWEHLELGRNNVSQISERWDASQLKALGPQHCK